MEESIRDVFNWGELGLAGAVIVSLAWAVVWLTRFMRSTWESTLSQHRTELEAHRMERAEMMNRFDTALERNERRSVEANDRLSETIKELSSVLRERRTP